MILFDIIENLFEFVVVVYEVKMLLLNEKLKNSLSVGCKMVDIIIIVFNECGYISIKSI